VTPSNDGAKVGDLPRRTRSVTYCARCGALETMHEIRPDGTRGRRLGTSSALHGVPLAGVACPGYQPGRTEERPPEEELRRRLAAVTALHEPWGFEPLCAVCDDQTEWPCPTVLAARGEL
jgi:hypothetical protein